MFRPTAVRALGVAALIVVATGVTGCLDSVITEHGSGDLETRDYEVGEFTSIEAHRALRVNVTVDPNAEASVTVTMVLFWLARTWAIPRTTFLRAFFSFLAMLVSLWSVPLSRPNPAHARTGGGNLAKWRSGAAAGTGLAGHGTLPRPVH